MSVCFPINIVSQTFYIIYEGEKRYVKYSSDSIVKIKDKCHARAIRRKIKYKNVRDKETFVKDVKRSRNYYTHYSASGEKHALKKTELFYLNEKLKILLVCAFLLEVGFDKEKLEKLLDRNKYRFFNGLVKW